jgi:hypothetical protein
MVRTNEPGRPSLDEAVQRATDDRKAIDRVAAASFLVVLAERHLRDVVAEAMILGDASWADIGRELGVTRQAAFQRFRERGAAS